MATAFFSEPPANALLESASLEGDVSGVLSALSLGASVVATDSSGYTALHNATFAGKHALQVFEALLAAGADPNARTTENQETPLHLVHNADTGIDWKLCTGSIDGRGSFFSAALVELLIKHGAKVNAKASDGSTALHAAAEAGATATVMALLHAGADVDARDGDGLTALAYAVTCEHGDVVAVLRKAGADPHVADDDGETPLSAASEAMRAILAGAAP